MNKRAWTSNPSSKLERKKFRMVNPFVRWVGCFCAAVGTAFLFPVMAMAATPSVDNLKTSITDIGDIIAGFASPIFTIVLIVAGIAMMTGQQGRQWAKPTMLFGGIGYVVVTFAATIVSSFETSFR